MSLLADWYRDHGRHDLAWRATRDRWAVLVSEVMLAQTQVQRVEVAWPEFMRQFPTVEATAAAEPGDLIVAWGRLGYPRRARRLWEAARIVAEHGWPDDYRDLPGVGNYTAGALAAQADDDPDAIGIDVNIRRVVQRFAGELLNDTRANEVAVKVARPLDGRDRLLALMDLGATVCTPRQPRCQECPLRRRCAAKGPLDGEVTARQAPYEGSMRQRRGRVLEALRNHDRLAVEATDQEALASLVADALVSVDDGWVRPARA